MQDYEKGFIALVVMGGLIALGKLLNSDEPITLRLVAGRVIVGAGLSVIAGVALYFVPNIHPLALLGFGSGLGILDKTWWKHGYVNVDLPEFWARG